MVDIKLKDRESGYSVIGDYIRRYWNYNNHEDTVVVSIGTSHDGHNYYFRNLIVSPLYYPHDGDIEFLDDWWEGEKYIKLFGIKEVNKIDISGGIYTEE